MRVMDHRAKPRRGPQSPFLGSKPFEIPFVTAATPFEFAHARSVASLPGPRGSPVLGSAHELKALCADAARNNQKCPSTPLSWVKVVKLANDIDLGTPENRNDDFPHRDVPEVA